jgi:GT2 family glycosyltransferase
MILSIIIVSYNTKQLLKDCIDSIENSLIGISYEIIVVDNASIDGSIDMIRTDYPNAVIIDNNYNAGFAKANNQGYQISSGKYILLLNSDTVILKDALNKLVNFMDKHSNSAVVGPRLLNPDLSLQLPCRRGFPKLINSIAHFSRLSRTFPKNKLLSSYNMTYMDDQASHEVDAVSGACLLVRRSIINEIGGLLDESFFMHFEDIDLCYRVKKHGYKVYYIHDAEIVHLKGQSSKLRSLGVIKNFYESAFTYFKKNYRHENYPAYLTLVIIITCMKYFSIVYYRLKALLR